MQAIDDYISKVRHLPPAPRVVPELLKLLNQADVDSSRVVKLISLEPSLTANVLRVCNSAYFAPALAISDVQEAITRLGFQQVFQLVTAATTAKLLSPPQDGYGLDHGELWKHSVASAAAAQLMARQLGDDENLVFTATLLHDIGKVVLAQAIAGSYAKLLHEAETHQLALVEVEKKLLGFDHAEVGGRLLERWRFPANIVSAVTWHHSPKSAEEHQRLASFVYLGNMIAYFMGHGYGHLAFALRGRADALAILGLASESIPQYMMDTFEQMQMIHALFSLANDPHAEAKA
jgi:putative nucleotidyltransferase with HDIG domain